MGSFESTKLQELVKSPGRKPPGGKPPGGESRDAITRGQRAINQTHAKPLGLAALKEDGLINPDGPTQSATRKLAKNLTAKNITTSDLADSTKQISSMRRIRDMAEREAQLPSHPTRPAHPRNLLEPPITRKPVQSLAQTGTEHGRQFGRQPWWKQGAIVSISADGQASNVRTVNYFKGVSSVGDIPR